MGGLGGLKEREGGEDGLRGIEGDVIYAYTGRDRRESHQY